MNVHRPFVFLALLGVAYWARADEPKLNILDRDGVQIQYRQDDETLARDLHAWIKTQIVHESRLNEFDVRWFDRNREAIFRCLCERLALSRTPPAAPLYYDRFVGIVSRALEALPDVRRYRIWRYEEIEHFLQSGGDVRGYDIDLEKNAVNIQARYSENYQIEIDGGQPSGATQIDAQITTFDPIPLIVRTDEKNPLEKFQSIINDYIEAVNFVTENKPWYVLHETAEATVLYQYGLSNAAKYRRWFTDGMAEYLSYAILRRLGEDRYADSLLKNRDASKYESIKDRVHLGSWLGADKGKDLIDNNTKLLRDARYTFAFHEILELTKRCGEDCIPKIFTALEKKGRAPDTPPQDEGSPIKLPERLRDVHDVYQAILEATGEDFTRRLLQYTRGVADAPPMEVQP